MKSNEAPEKIYIPINNTIEPGFLEDYWVESPVLGQEVEYTRTDAFIEKACDWLESVNLDFYQIREGVFSRQLVEDFKKYMEGE